LIQRRRPAHRHHDLDDNADPETVAANLKTHHRQIWSAQFQDPIILCQVFPSSETRIVLPTIKWQPGFTPPPWKATHKSPLIETCRFLPNAQGDAKLEEFPDLLHPNKRLRKMAAALFIDFVTFGLMDPSR